MMKKRISTALMSENPVSSPMVPPIAESLSMDLAFWSYQRVGFRNPEKEVLTLVTLSKVELSKKILTKWSLLLNFKSIKRK